MHIQGQIARCLSLRHGIWHCHLDFLTAIWLDSGVKGDFLPRQHILFARHGRNQGSSLPATLHGHIHLQVKQVRLLFLVAQDNAENVVQLPDGNLRHILCIIKHIPALNQALLAIIAAQGELQGSRRAILTVESIADGAVHHHRCQHRYNLLVVGQHGIVRHASAGIPVMDGDDNRHRLRHLPQDAPDAILPVLVDAADDAVHIAQLHAVGRTMDGADDLGIRHEVVYVAPMGIGMAEGKDFFVIHCCDSSHGTEGKITYGQGNTHRRARLQHRIRPCLHYGGTGIPHIIIVKLHPQPAHALLQKLHALAAKAGGKISILFLCICQNIRRSIFLCLRSSILYLSNLCIRNRISLVLIRDSHRSILVLIRGSLTVRFLLRFCRLEFLPLRLQLPQIQLGKLRPVQGIRILPYFQHILDRSQHDALGRIHILVACGQCPCQPAAKINGAAAHAGNGPACFLNQITIQIDQDSLGGHLAVIPQDSHHFYIKGADFTAAVNHGIACPPHARLYILQADNLRQCRHGSAPQQQ